jgi:hypothetical protein
VDDIELPSDVGVLRKLVGQGFDQVLGFVEIVTTERRLDCVQTAGQALGKFGLGFPRGLALLIGEALSLGQDARHVRAASELVNFTRVLGDELDAAQLSGARLGKVLSRL